MIRSCRNGIVVVQRRQQHQICIAYNNGNNTSSSSSSCSCSTSTGVSITTTRSSLSSTSFLPSSSIFLRNPLLHPSTTTTRNNVQQHRIFHTSATVSSSSTLLPSSSSSLSLTSKILPSSVIIEKESYVDTEYNFPIHNNELYTKLMMSNNYTNNQSLLYNLQIVRWKGRNDGSRYEHKERRVSRKSIREYNRQRQKDDNKIHKVQPGYKANIKREYYNNMQEQIIEDVEALQQLGPNASTIDLPDPLVELNKSTNEYTLADALVDDLFYNTTNDKIQIESAIEPNYIGHKYDYYYNKVSTKMKQYNTAVATKKKQQQEQLLSGQGNTNNAITTKAISSSSSELSIDIIPEKYLPSDNDISLVLRSYRDKFGTKKYPIGIMNALQFILQDLQIPINELYEKTYTTLLTCCTNVTEGRRVIQLMKDRSFPISNYSYSILVDIAARTGDYKTCLAIHQEMLMSGGTECKPTLVSYTSILSACYMVCVNGGYVSHSVRAEAAKVAWETWKEMIINNIEPDIQAYGALLRILGITGQPEKALNILDEMTIHKRLIPTTICYTAALRAVARSHSTAIRYESGSSIKNKRREYITKHHGTMAKTLLIQAESHNIIQDDSFIAALMLCVAEAGDLPTAKAIYISHQIRNIIYPKIIPNSNIFDTTLNNNTNTTIPIEQQQSQQSQLDQFLASSDGSGDQEDIAKMLFQSLQDYINDKDDKDESLLSSISSSEDTSSTIAKWLTEDNSSNLSATAATNNENSITQKNNNSSNVQQVQHQQEQQQQQVPLTYKQREYGLVDNRILTSLLHACARSVDSTMIGTMWQGRENDGYLCENSLRLINARRIPNYEPETIPGSKISDLLTTDEEKHVRNSKDYRPGKRVGGRAGRKEFRGVYVDQDIENQTLDDLTEEYQKIYMTDDGQLKKEFQKPTPDEIWQMKYGPTRSGINEYPTITTEPGPELLLSSYDNQYDNDTIDMIEVTNDDYYNNSNNNIDTDSTNQTSPTKGNEMYFDDDTMTWKTKTDPVEEITSTTPITVSSNDTTHVQKSEMYFDYDTMSWKSNEVITEINTATSNTMSSASVTVSATNSTPTPTPRGPNEIYFDKDTMQWINHQNYPPSQSQEPRSGRISSTTIAQTINATILKSNSTTTNTSDVEDWYLSDKPKALASPAIDEEKEYQSFLVELQKELDVEGDMQVSDQEARELFEMMQGEYGDDINEGENVPKQLVAKTPNQHTLDTKVVTSNELQTYDDTESAEYDLEQSFSEQGLEWDENLGEYVDKYDDDNEMISASDANDLEESPLAESDEEVVLWQLEELRKYLPQYSDQRRLQILKVMETSLGKPQLYELIEITREKMPDYVTSTWLKQMATLTAQFVMYQAAQDGKINSHLINSAIELQTSAGGIESALEAHSKLFDEHRVIPTEYSDRLVLQMLLKNNRLQRALVFKHNVEQQGRILDLKSYGSLVDYFGRRQQAGSAMLMLQECITVHQSPPSEASIAKLRVLFRQSNVDQRILTDLVGPDPIQWLKDGEANLKREKSKRGNRGVMAARNVLLRV